MAKVLGNVLLSFANIAGRGRTRDDDSIDQLNHWATTALMMAMAMGTGAKQFVGVPIRCWLPAQYKKKMYQMYANHYCWLSHMYYVPFSEPIPFEEEDRWEVDVSFYRWVTVMFLIQALLYKLPNLFWRELKGYSGLNVQKVIAMTLDTSLMTQDKRDEKLSHTAYFMHRWLQTYTLYQYSVVSQFREKLSGILFCFGKRTGTYLTGLYMLSKILYVANSIGQFFMLSAFLGLDYWYFGINAMHELSKNGRWQDLYTFPRVGMCDYKIRQMANVQTFSVQCVLSINLFLEKMYLLVWFWMVGLMVANIISLGMWFYNEVMPGRTEGFMSRYARLLGIDNAHDKTLFKLFVFNYLRRDGVFIIRMVEKNVGGLLTTDLVRQMWQVFINGLEKRDGRNGIPKSLPRQPSAPAEEGDEGAGTGKDFME